MHSHLPRAMVGTGQTVGKEKVRKLRNVDVTQQDAALVRNRPVEINRNLWASPSPNGRRCPVRSAEGRDELKGPDEGIRSSKSCAPHPALRASLSRWEREYSPTVLGSICSFPPSCIPKESAPVCRKLSGWN